VDERAAELMRLHAGHLVCRAGCTACCVNLTVLPVEFEAIRRSLACASGDRIPFDTLAACGFLTASGLCSIYAHRPIICRTHGLPIAFAGEDGEGCSVSFCQRNFTDADEDELDFGPENTLDVDVMNEHLSRLNLAYLAESGVNPSADGRIELRKLTEQRE
jgi:Fe-S-cluster containining protein